MNDVFSYGLFVFTYMNDVFSYILFILAYINIVIPSLLSFNVWITDEKSCEISN